jgi:NADH-quinone oxidoreductase subunit N
MGEQVLLWVPLAAGLATLTIVAGNLMAIPQQNVKRLFAYSGIAHIGYMLIGFAAVSAEGVAMMLFYLVAYLFGNMGAFLVVEAVAQSDGSESLSAYRGLAQRSPVLALSMLLFLLSLGGIPFVAGFWAKLYVFWAAAQQGLYWLVLVGAILTVVALFYYLLVAKRMYIDAPEKMAPVTAPFLLNFSSILGRWSPVEPQAQRQGRRRSSSSAGQARMPSGLTKSLVPVAESCQASASGNRSLR